VFAQYRASLDLVEAVLFSAHGPFAGVRHLRMDGGVKPGLRQGIADRFNGDKTVKVLLLTTSVGGLGLNLTGADTVVFLEHDWNPSKDLQGKVVIVNTMVVIVNTTSMESE
jgi:TATA-binding protein-associated factor